MVRILLIISYDIQNDKLRNRFHKFINQYGTRLQFSVYEIRNSNRILSIIENEINETFMPLFSEDDTVMIFRIDDNRITRYGYAKHDEENDMIVVE